MSERNITVYYIGGDGREDRPHRILYGARKLVVTPPLGEPFAQKFTAREYKELRDATAITYGDRIIYPVTDSKAVADARKKGRTVQDVLENMERLTLTTEDLIAELTERPEAIEKLRALLMPQPIEESAPKRATKKEVIENG